MMDGEGTPIGARRCVDLLRGFASRSDRERFNWSDVPSDWNLDGEFDYHECRTLGEVLAQCQGQVRFRCWLEPGAPVTECDGGGVGCVTRCG